MSHSPCGTAVCLCVPVTSPCDECVCVCVLHLLCYSEQGVCTRLSLSDTEPEKEEISEHQGPKHTTEVEEEELVCVCVCLLLQLFQCISHRSV